MDVIRLLTFSTLFPHAARPNQGIFVENRLRHLLASGKATSRVLAPVPWFPSRSARFGDWAVNAMAPRQETRHGIEIEHPRYPVIPKIGMSMAPWLLYRAMVPRIEAMLRAGHQFDAIDAHYIYRQLDSVKHQYGCFLETYLGDGVPTVSAPGGLMDPCDH